MYLYLAYNVQVDSLSVCGLDTTFVSVNFYFLFFILVGRNKIEIKGHLEKREQLNICQFNSTHIKISPSYGMLLFWLLGLSAIVVVNSTSDVVQVFPLFNF